MYDYLAELDSPMPKHVVAYSGGHSSALVAIEVTRRFGKENVILLNHDIKASSEDLDIKRFKEAVAGYLGLPVTFANMEGWDKKDQFDVVIEAQAFKVGDGTALCTNRMKTRPFEKWLAENFPRDPDPMRRTDKGDAIIYYGFDRSENGRIQRRSSHLALLGYATDYPLALWKERTIWTTEEIGIAPPRTYSRFKHANCAGCLKAGRQHWYVVYCTRPDIWERAKMAEDNIEYSIIKGVYLEELEPLFEQMKLAGVPPNEHTPFQTFWADVRKMGITCKVDQSESLPCECVI